MEPTIIDAAGIYNRRGELQREVTVLPDGSFIDPLDLAPDEVVYMIAKCGDKRWFLPPVSLDPMRPPWARDIA